MEKEKGKMISWEGREEKVVKRYMSVETRENEIYYYFIVSKLISLMLSQLYFYTYHLQL